MDREYYDCAREIGRKGGFWKFIAAILFVALAIMSVNMLLLKLKNKEYKEVLIKNSESIPNTPEQEAELAEIRKREWGRGNAPKNKKTTEEILEENRVIEEF